MRKFFFVLVFGFLVLGSLASVNAGENRCKERIEELGLLNDLPVFDITFHAMPKAGLKYVTLSESITFFWKKFDNASQPAYRGTVQTRSCEFRINYDSVYPVKSFIKLELEGLETKNCLEKPSSKTIVFPSANDNFFRGDLSLGEIFMRLIEAGLVKKVVLNLSQKDYDILIYGSHPRE